MAQNVATNVGAKFLNLITSCFPPDLEKVVNHPQAENSELYNVLKIVWFATKCDKKYVYLMFVQHDKILKS